jgi:hypothetical protein
MTLVDDIKILLAAPTMNGSDIRTLLRKDHEEAVKIARDMVDSEGAEERRALFKQLRPLLAALARAEQKEVYEALLKVKVAGPVQDLAYEGIVLHGVADDLMEKMSKSRKTETDEWKAHAKVLLGLLERHIDAEQGRVFDALEDQFDDAQREDMGRRFLATKARVLVPKFKAA